MYADDDKSITIDYTDVNKAPSTQRAAHVKKASDHDLFKTPSYNVRENFVSPQAKLAFNAKRINRKGDSLEASATRHQGELENVISMLSKFEQSRRGEESVSISISRSYIEGATGLGHNPKQTPQGVAL